jgi:integrase/recombinase XerD
MNITLINAIGSFLDSCKYERKLSPHSCKAYALDLRGFSQFLGPRTPKLPVHQVTRSDVSEFLKSLDSLKPRTVRRKLATLKSFFSFLERECHLSESPVRLIRLKVHVGRQLPKSINLESIKFLLASIRREVKQAKTPEERKDYIRDVAIFETLFLSGMRVAELSHLKVRSLDLKNGTILILGKGNRERIIPLCSKPVNLAIIRHLRASMQRNSDSFLFLNRWGRRLSEQSIRSLLRRYARDAGLGKITPHMIRHTVASLLLGRGADLRNIQILLGHSSITTTTIYTHVNDSRQREVLTALHPRNLF